MFLQEEKQQQTHTEQTSSRKLTQQMLCIIFENDGVVLNPLGTSPDNNNFQYAPGTTGADGSIVTIDQTLIYNYVNNDINSYVITNSSVNLNSMNQKDRFEFLVQNSWLS